MAPSTTGTSRPLDPTPTDTDDQRAGDQRVDGRHARSDRSRAAVADALLALVNDGIPKPTAEQIAGRAGVSIRSVFRHTADSEALARTLVELHISRTSDLFDLPGVDGPLDRRIERLVAHRQQLFETITPVRRAVRVAHASFGGVLRARVEEVNDLLRTQLVEVFAPELTAAGPARERLLDAIDMATSWPAWEQLRVDQGLEPDDAGRVVSTVLAALTA